jgi:hypothetical protein
LRSKRQDLDLSAGHAWGTNGRDEWSLMATHGMMSSATRASIHAGVGYLAYRSSRLGVTGELINAVERVARHAIMMLCRCSR